MASFSKHQRPPGEWSNPFPLYPPEAQSPSKICRRDRFNQGSKVIWYIPLSRVLVGEERGEGLQGLEKRTSNDEQHWIAACVFAEALRREDPSGGRSRFPKTN